MGFQRVASDFGGGNGGRPAPDALCDPGFVAVGFHVQTGEFFNQAWLEEFLGILNQQHPKWLSGIVFGPQVRISLPRLRELVPAQYPIRHYPDITHSRQCQYPVPDWDIAYAVTEGRECINPRPED